MFNLFSKIFKFLVIIADDYSNQRHTGRFVVAELLNYLLAFCYLLFGMLSFLACLQDEGSSFTPNRSGQDPEPIPKQTAHAANRMVMSNKRK